MVDPTSAKVSSHPDGLNQLTLFDSFGEAQPDSQEQNEAIDLPASPLERIQSALADAYTGEAGWGKLDYPLNHHLDEIGESSSENTEITERSEYIDLVQMQLWSTSEPQSEDLPDSIEVPVTKKPKRRSRRVKREEVQYLDFGDKPDGEVVEGPEPELKSKFVRKVNEFPDYVTRENKEKINVVESIDELAERYSIQNVTPGLLHSKHEQMRCVMVALERSHNVFLEADTSFGKTVVELLIAAKKLSDGEKVVIMTPNVDLVDQIYKEFQLFFDFPVGTCVPLSGKDKVKDRPNLYHNPNTKLVITTPQGFYHDLRDGVVTPEDFPNLIGDEGHLAVGNTKYLKALELYRDSGKLIRLFSATLPDGDESRQQMLDASGIDRDRVYRFYSDEKPVFDGTTIHQLRDPLMMQVAEELYLQAALAGHQFYKTMRVLAGDSRGVRVAENDLADLFQKYTRLAKDRFDFPSDKQKGEIHRRLAALSDSDFVRFKDAHSYLAEFGYRINLYNTFARFGKYAFLRYVGEEIYAYRFGGTRRNKKAKGEFFKRVFNRIESDSLLGNSFRALAGDRLIGKLASRKSFGSLMAEAAKVNCPQGLESQKPESCRKAFFEACEDDIVRDASWYDGPLTERAINLVERHSTFGRSEQIMIYVESADTAIFIPKLINHVLRDTGKEALPYVGASRLSSRVRKQNLEKYKDELVNIIAATSSIRVGINSKATILIKLSHDPNTSAIKQLFGRIAREEGRVGIGYYEVLRGTQDFIRFYAGWQRLKKEGQVGKLTS